MKQINQIGKYTKKQDKLNGKRGRTFTTPKNRSNVFDYIKEGQIPELNYIDMDYDGRQTRLIKQQIESLNSDDYTLIYAMQDAADEYKSVMDWEIQRQNRSANCKIIRGLWLAYVVEWTAFEKCPGWATL